MSDFDQDEITRVILRRLGEQLLRAAEDLPAAVRQAEPAPEGPDTDTSLRDRARVRNELLAELRRCRR